VDAGKLFPLVGETRTPGEGGGHSLRVNGRPFRTEMRGKLLQPERAVGVWNSLPQRAVEAGSLSVFKTEIDKFLIARGWGGSKVTGRERGEWR